jgi:hypothetical protein
MKNMPVKFGSELHSKLYQAAKARVQLSKNKLATYYEKWRKAEDEDAIYIKESEVDGRRRTQRETSGVPQFTTIHVPYTYATGLSAHTYWSNVFLGRTPKFQFTGRHGEAENQVKALEAIIDYQSSVGKLAGPINLWLNDVRKYGVGYFGIDWIMEEITVSEIVEQPKTWRGLPLIGTSERKRVIKNIPGYEGNRGFNIRPQDALPDPRVPADKIQEGEFFGRRLDLSWNELAIGAIQGRYINIEIVKQKERGYTQDQSELEVGSDQVDLPNDTAAGAAGAAGLATSEGLYDPTMIAPIEAIELIIKLIPKDWGVGNSPRPEIWKLTYTTRSKIIIQFGPTGDYHGKIPRFCLPYELDAHSFMSRGLYEITQPLTNTMDWIFNTHFYNVRAALNNQFIVDPSRVVWKDLLSNEPGLKIRLRDTAYGTDVRTAIQQLPVVDVTQNYTRDIQIVMDLIQRVTGITDNIMGMVNNGGRKTATEVRSSNTFGINRMKTLTEYWSEEDYGLMAQVLVQNTQQRYNEEKMFRIAGDNFGDMGDPTVLVAPQDIQGFFDFIPVDGSMPVDKFALANLWKEILFNVVPKAPDIAMRYDIGSMFEWMAQLAGMKNIKQFRVKLGDPGQLAAQAQQGNLVPMRNQGERRVPQPRQMNGVGPLA